MNDLNDRLDALLNDPDVADKLNSILSGLSGEKEETSASPLPDLDVGNLLSLLNGFSFNDNKEGQLLCALKPYLSEGRQKRVDEAEKLLSLYRLLPILSKFTK